MFAMDTPLSYLEEPRLKVERNLNFATLPNDEDDFGFSRKKTARDPMSHRIIEKRRRDRMNNCLADLSRLVPTNYLKKGRGRIEKTEIIEMAIKHLKHLQAHPCKDPGSCEVAKSTEQDHKRQFRQGYQECMSETMKFVMEVEGAWIGDGLGIRLVDHLQKHYDKMSGGVCYTQALHLMASEESKSSVHMDVDGSCFSSEATSDGSLQHNHTLPAYYEGGGKGSSQLREMLQNPGLPKERPRPPSPTAEEGCYKFKNTIKHRFNADLRHHTSSPTDARLVSLPDEDAGKEGSPSRPCEDRAPVLLCHSSSHAFSPYRAPVSELSVKIPERTAREDGGALSSTYGTQHWDSHAETASSCGSNPSPPPNTARSSGSSSGYSTNGDNHSKPKGGAHSPALSPYSRLSPSPLQPGVPIFALHPKGTFYVPLTVDSSLLVPYMVGADDDAPVLHPISICVNLGGHSVKVEKSSSSSFLMDKFHDRLAYADRQQQQLFYPGSPASNKNA